MGPAWALDVVLGTAAAFVTAAAAVYGLSRPNAWLQILDHPNERSLHDRPTPRTGGIGVLAGIFLGGALILWSVDASAWLAWLALPAALLGGVSFLDDRYGLPAAVRLGVHLAVAGWLAAQGYALDALELPGVSWQWPMVVGVPFSILFIVWMINLYNFMDGMDGLAGGMAVFGFGTLGALAWWAGEGVSAGAAGLVAAASGGFLLWNFPPARIFLGDSGSAVLGLLAAVLSLRAVNEGWLPLWAVVLVFSPFLVDATVTLLRRLLRGDRIWRAHRSHYYQRLAGLGWSHRRTALAEYAVMVACGVSAALAWREPPTVQWVVIISWAAVYTALFTMIGLYERRYKGYIQSA